MGWWETIKTLNRELQKEKTREIVKGFALKTLPDLAMSGLMAIPVVGWAASLLGIPINVHLTKKGERIIKENEKHLDRNNKVDNGLRHGLKFQNEWNSEQQFVGKKKRPLAEYLVEKYNKTVDGLFHTSPKLVEKLKINYKDNSRTFRSFKRFTDARQALRQTPMLGRVFNWMSGINGMGGGAVGKVLPKPLQLLMLLPRMGLLGIYFLLGIRPKFPK